MVVGFASRVCDRACVHTNSALSLRNYWPSKRGEVLVVGRAPFSSSPFWRWASTRERRAR